MKASLDRPKLRPLSAQRYEHQGQVYAALQDPLGFLSDTVLIPFEGFQRIVRHFDGQSSLAEIQARVLRETGQRVTWEELKGLVEQLDRALVLEGPTFAALCEREQAASVRPPALAGRSYPAGETALRFQLAQYFEHPEGAGRSRTHGTSHPGTVRGVLSPHIDFYRGGPAYTWAYRELVERAEADVYVILGVAHQHCRRRFALTRKDFATPLGTAATDRVYVDRIATRAGRHYFDDEPAHRPEHSIEFQVVFLQYVLGARRDYSIVPILVGSFHDLMLDGIDPIDNEEVRRFVAALQDAEQADGRRVAYIGGIDLSHVGPEFGDLDRVDEPTRERLRASDAAMLERALANDPAGWFATASKMRNRSRICGLAATYTMLHAMGPTTGRLLKYDQAVDDLRTCCVSFASVAFDAPAHPAHEVASG